MALTTFSRVERRRLTMFLCSLVVAILAWLFFAMSGRYVYQVNSKINFVDPPLHRAYQPLHDDTVTFQMEGTGWQLLFSRFRLHPPSVNVSLKSLNSRDYITFSEQMRYLSRQFQSNQKVISVSPDTLFFDFSRRITKKVPVKLLYLLSFQKPFGVSGPIKITPDSVIVTGAAADVASIHSWFTDTLIMKNINTSVNTRIKFKTSPKNNINIFPQQVKVEVPVDEFTEKVIDVPLRTLNRRGEQFKLVPEKVQITILSALSNYSKAERDSFEAVVNFDGWFKHNYPQLPVHLVRLPAHSKLVKVEPQTVDFLIYKE